MLPPGFNPARFPVEIPQANSWEARKHGCMCPSCSSETTSGKSLFKKNTRVLIVILFNVRHDLIYHDITNSSNLFLAWDHRSCNHCWLALSRWRPPPGSQCLGVVTWSVWYESFKRFQSKLHIESIKKIQRSVVVSKSESRVTEKTGDFDLMDLGGFYFQMFHDTFDFGPGFWSLLRSSWCNQVSVGYGPHPGMPLTTRIVTCLMANSYKPEVFAWKLRHESAKSQTELLGLCNAQFVSQGNQMPGDWRSYFDKRKWKRKIETGSNCPSKNLGR